MSAGNNYHNEIIKIRVNKALEKKEAQFAEEHKNDTDQQLLFYIHQQALLIHHTPRKREITGWRYISERFGGWDRAILKSGLKPSEAVEPISECPMIKEETALQEQLLKDHKTKKTYNRYHSRQRWCFLQGDLPQGHFKRQHRGHRHRLPNDQTSRGRRHP